MAKKRGKHATRRRPPEVEPRRDAPPESGRSDSRARLLFAVGLASIAFLAILAFVLLRPRPSTRVTSSPAAEEAGPSADGQERMLAELHEIRERSREDNLYLGEARAREAREALASLADDADPKERWRLLVDLAELELRLGNEEAAIADLEEAAALADRLGAALAPPGPDETLFRLGVAHLRRAETLNCARNHNAESCILPLRGGGIHADPTEARAAMRLFLTVAQRTAMSTHLHIKSLWLLNLAGMAVAAGPDEIPPDLRIPTSVFASTYDIPRFANVAPSLGLATFDLFGSAVADDFDGDGWIDLFTSTFDTAVSPRLFRNRGDGTFEDVSEQAGLDGLFGGLNAVQADYDNDGDVDLYVLRGAWLGADGRHPNSLLRNDGKGHFRDVTFEAGLGAVHYPTQTAAWADYDNDGDLDLYVGNEHDPRVIDAPSQLFRNEGDGTFVDVAAAAGVESRTFVKGVTWGDYDGDRDPDLYVSTNGGPNRLYRNDGDGTFTDVAPQLDVWLPMDSFPVWFWDFDNDGVLDLYVAAYRGVTGALANVALSAFGAPPGLELGRLYHGDGHGGFRDVAPDVGLDRLHLAMGSNFGDLDNDGWLDFYLGTGYPDFEALMPNAMYRNADGRRFDDVTWSGGFGHLQKGHAVAFADFDHDGDQDVFEQMGGTFPGDRFADALYRNPGFGNHWLALKLVGTRSNRSAIGARIRVDVVDGGTRRSIFRWVTSGGSFGASPLRQSIGLGRAERADLEVYWPTSDLTQRFEAVRVDRIYRIEEGASEMVELPELLPSGRAAGDG